MNYKLILQLVIAHRRYKVDTFISLEAVNK